MSVDLDDETKENESKEKVGEENVPLVEEIQVPSGRCLVEEERQAGGQKRTEAWILETSLYKGRINFSKSSSYIFKRFSSFSTIGMVSKMGAKG